MFIYCLLITLYNLCNLHMIKLMIRVMMTKMRT